MVSCVILTFVIALTAITILTRLLCLLQPALKVTIAKESEKVKRVSQLIQFRKHLALMKVYSRRRSSLWIEIRQWCR